MLLMRPWGEGDSLLTVGLCLITDDFWSTSARGARAPEEGQRSELLWGARWGGATASQGTTR